MTTNNATFTNTANGIFALFRDNADTAVETLTNAYNGAEKGQKTSIRANVSKAAIVANNANDTFTALALLTAVSGLAPIVDEKAPIDANVVVGTFVANHLEAAFRVMSGDYTLTGADGVEKVIVADSDTLATLRTFITGMDLPDASAKAVESMTIVRVGKKTRSNHIGDLIAESFENVPVGTFRKISEIRDAIGTLHPEKGVTDKWDGRINAHLFDRIDNETVEKDNLPETVGVRAYPTGNAIHPKGLAGAVKVESDVWGDPDDDDLSDNADESGAADES